METESYISLGGLYFTRSFCTKNSECYKNVCQMEYTPLYEKAIKQNQNKPMEITKLLDGWDERRKDVG